MNNTDFNNKLAHYSGLVNERLHELINELPQQEQKTVCDAMDYSISAGGKRIRPILMLEFCRLCGGDCVKALNFACALEMIHTYSLIHDDLPCMDNDDFRRGQPSCHVRFGEAFALLAGDALLNRAFEIASSTENCELVGDSVALKAIRYLATASGICGMIGGQTIDLLNENTPVDSMLLDRINLLKTGALIKAACSIGVIIGEGNNKQLAAAESYAENLGLAFQIIDDILDVVGDADKLGKPINSDADNNKSTYVSLFGLKKSKDIALSLTDNAIESLSVFTDNEFLIELTKMLCNRSN